MKKNQLLFRNFSWLLLNKIVNIVAGLVSSIIVVRYIGAVNNGILNYAISFCSLFAAISAMGAENFITKEFAKKDADTGLVAGTSFVMLSIGSVIAISSCIVSAHALQLHSYYIVIISLQFLTKPLVIYQYWFIGTSNSKYYSITQNIVHIACLLVKVLLVLLKSEFVFFVIVTAVEYVVLDIGLLVAYLFSGIKFSTLHFSSHTLRYYFRICIPLILSAIAITVYMRFDQLMIGSFLGEGELGVYSVAVKLAEYWYFIPQIIYNTIFPELAKIFEDSPNYKKRLQQFSDIQGGLAIIVATGFTLLSRYIVLILYGYEYIDAGPILAVYCWAGVFVSLGYVKVAHCTNCNISKFQMISTIIGALANIGLNALLIPLIGAIGAAWATVIAQFVSSVILCVIYPPLKEIGIMQIKSLFPYIRLLKTIKNER